VKGNGGAGEDFRPGYLGNYSDSCSAAATSCDKGDPRASAFYDDVFAHIRKVLTSGSLL